MREMWIHCRSVPETFVQGYSVKGAGGSLGRPVEARKDTPQEELRPRKARAGSAPERVCVCIRRHYHTYEDVVVRVETR